MKLDKCMSTLAIEMTCRCNLNCNFCGKGTAQNVDISKEIIDKTLDEMKDTYINALRISGGEPLLAPEMICYLVDQITKRHIYLNSVVIFTNGNVFPGCLMSYERVDKEYMFNILDCKNNFFDLVNDFCWMHPLNEKAIKIRSYLKGINFCKEKNIKVKHMPPSDYELMKALSKLVDACEYEAKDIHAKLPDLDFTTVDLLASTDLVLNMFDKKIDIDFIKEYLKRCTTWDEEEINMISPKWCKGLIDFLVEEYKNENKNEGEKE